MTVFRLAGVPIEENVGYFVIGDEWTVRIRRFDDGDSDAAHMWLQAPSGEFQAGLEWAQPIVDGITTD